MVILQWNRHSHQSLLTGWTATDRTAPTSRIARTHTLRPGDSPQHRERESSRSRQATRPSRRVAARTSEMSVSGRCARTAVRLYCAGPCPGRVCAATASWKPGSRDRQHRPRHHRPATAVRSTFVSPPSRTWPPLAKNSAWRTHIRLGSGSMRRRTDRHRSRLPSD